MTAATAQLLVALAIVVLGVCAAWHNGIRRLLMYLFAHRWKRAKCPGCGSLCKKKTVWTPTAGMLTRECPNCQAMWGEPPIADPGLWSPRISPEQWAAQQKFSRHVVSREPVVVKDARWAEKRVNNG